MKLFCALLLLISTKGFAQYPFEKYPSIKYDTVPFKIIEGEENYTNIAYANYKDYRIELLEKRLSDSSNVLIYRKNKLIKKIKGDDFVSTYLDGPLCIGDFNKDGLLDFKITIGNVGATGLASSRETKFYLINKGNNKFSGFSFCDFFNQKERDIGREGNYKIVGQRLVYYKKHNYWLFDLYYYRNGKLVNVSKKYGYPIAVQYLERDNYTVTNKISKKQLERLSLKIPEFYTRYK